MKERNALVRKCTVSTALVTVLGSITLLKNPGYREYLELYIWFLVECIEPTTQLITELGP